MKYQSRSYTCGPASIRNSLKALGITKAEKTILKLTRTTENGTSEENMIAAIQELGLGVLKHEQETFKRAWNWLEKQLASGNPVIILINNWAHYITCVGLLGERILVFDPDKAVSGKENGLFVWSKRQLKKKWYHSVEKLYSGIAITK